MFFRKKQNNSEQEARVIPKISNSKDDAFLYGIDNRANNTNLYSKHNFNLDDDYEEDIQSDKNNYDDVDFDNIIFDKDKEKQIDDNIRNITNKLDNIDLDESPEDVLQSLNNIASAANTIKRNIYNNSSNIFETIKYDQDIKSTFERSEDAVRIPKVGVASITNPTVNNLEEKHEDIPISHVNQPIQTVQDIQQMPMDNNIAIQQVLNTNNQTTNNQNYQNTTIPSRTIVSTPQQQTKPTPEIEAKPEKKDKSGKKLSIILDQSLVRPIETVGDIERYVDERLYYEAEDENMDDAMLESVINSNPDIEYLDLAFCKKITNFSLLSRLKNLKHLNLLQCNLTSTAFFRDLKNLVAVNLSDTGITNIDDLADCQYIKAVNLGFNEKLKDITAIRNFHDLRDLGLWACGMLRDISAISGLTEIRGLDLEFTAVLDLTPIANLTKLEFFLLDNSLVTDLTPIKNLVNLKLFTMEDAKTLLKETDLHAFEGMTNMMTLILKNRGIPSLKYFSNMTKMVELQIPNNLIMDLSPIAGLTKLIKLDVSGNSKINTIEPLRNITSMEKLNLSGNAKSYVKIPDLSPLENMSKMDTFECAYNSVLKDISVFEKLPTTKEVNFAYCPLLEDINPLSKLPSLENVKLSGCTRVTDISPLFYYGPDQGEMYLDGTSISPSSLAIFKRVKKFNSFKYNSSSTTESMVTNSTKKRTKIYKYYRKKAKVED